MGSRKIEVDEPCTPSQLVWGGVLAFSFVDLIVHNSRFLTGFNKNLKPCSNAWKLLINQIVSRYLGADHYLDIRWDILNT